ncbi:hypothetical protein Trydic_g20986 [Trypoxylus dichotomus]
MTEGPYTSGQYNKESGENGITQSEGPAKPGGQFSGHCPTVRPFIVRSDALPRSHASQNANVYGETNGRITGGKVAKFASLLLAVKRFRKWSSSGRRTVIAVANDVDGRKALR